MKWMQIAAGMLLSVMLVLTAGCGSGKPPATAAKAVVYEEEAPKAAQAAAAPVESAESPDTASETAEAPAVPAAAEASETKTYVIEPNDDSAIDFVGYKVTGSQQGGFANFSGSVTVPGGDITRAAIQVSVDMPSVFSSAGALTEVLKGKDFFEVETYPAATFTSSAVESTPEGYLVKGAFDLHGVSKPIGFPAQISIEGNTLTASSEFTINRNDWGVSYAGVTDDLIKDEVLVKFEIVANAE